MGPGDEAGGEDGARGVILFDGFCRLCSGSVRFVFRRDPEGRFRFAALDSEVGRRLLARCGVVPETTDSVVLVEPGRCSLRSTAALRICRGLRFPWPLLSLLLLIPPPLRDALYDFVARRRLRWFGRLDQCFLPDAELSRRFLDDEEDGR